ncbi:MAG: preprotein translocase subunit YajC [Alphaproteobacteria bacterium]
MQDFHFISPAFAQETTAATVQEESPIPVQPASPVDSLMQFLPLFLILGVLYFLLIRPQQQKFQQHEQLLKSLRRGDKVVTGGGIIGTIFKLEGDDMLVVEIADNVRVKVQRATIAGVVARTEPVGAAGDGEQKTEEVKRLVQNDNKK